MMTIQELIENAVLDALGLLEPDEQAAFDRAFDAASPHVQAQVRREQARLAQLDRLLPDVEPPASLRAEVLGRLREEIAAEYLRRQEHRGPVLEILPSRKVSPIWRATAIGSLAAAIVFGVSVMQMSWQYDGLRKAIAKNQLLEEITQQFGSRYVRDVLFDTDTRRLVLASTQSDFHGEAALFFNPGWEAAQLYCAQLASRDGQRYRLAIVDENDRVVRELLAFEASGGLDAESVKINPEELARSNARVALIPERDDGTAMPVLQGDVAPLLGTS